MKEPNMTPEQIKIQHEKVTWEQVAEVVKELDKIVPNKALWNLVHVAKSEGTLPCHCLKRVLGSAYDWFAYGN